MRKKPIVAENTDYNLYEYVKPIKKRIKAPQVKKRIRKQYSKRLEEGKRTRMDYNRKVTYGLEKEEFDHMFTSQNGTCAICPTKLDSHDLSSVPCVDHNHHTGEIRQLLCQRCNKGIGFLRDNSLIAEKAMNYLRKWGC